MSIKSLYIHIPFCNSKCKYCDFLSWNASLDVKEAYISMLIDELSLYCDVLSEQKLETIYLGGGTPSLLPINLLNRLFYHMRTMNIISDSCEISMEVNPGTVDQMYLKAVVDIGINRLSIGGQSFFDHQLISMGRTHRSCDISTTVSAARNVGIDNISIDLMYGLPGQTMDEWQSSLSQAISLPITHISTYGLMLSSDSPWGRLYEAGNLTLPEESLNCEMQLYTMDFLSNTGFQQYEISNFAMNGYECRHNMAYWIGTDYLGVGLNASSYLNGVRYVDVDNMEDYRVMISENKFPIASKEILNDDERIMEDIFLGLRLNSGLDLNMIKKKYNIDLEITKAEIIDQFIKMNYLTCEKDHLMLTTSGILLANEIIIKLT